MAPRTFSARVRQRLYTFARRLATPFADSRRRRFLTDMVPGLVIANHVHLRKSPAPSDEEPRTSTPPKNDSAATSAASTGT